MSTTKVLTTWPQNVQIYAHSEGGAVEPSRNKIKRRLEKDGWYLSRHGSNHDIYRHPCRSGTITLPRHRTVTSMVARSITTRAGWTD